ncbi:MAG: ABC transporter permease [Candidatus Promineifilaceae bacterium]
MAITTFWTMAYRDIVRNGRRAVTTIIAVALGLMVVMLMAGLMRGMIDSGLRDNIRITTGHLQLRATTYELDKMSLLAQDLLDDPERLAEEVAARAEVQSAAPVLWTSTILSTPRESAALQMTGINPDDTFHEPLRQGIIAGTFLNADDRGQILLGKRLADEMEISVGDRVSLASGTANGSLEEGVFTVAGLFNTGFPGHDQNTVIMPFAQAQAFTDTGDRASSIIVMLNDREDTQAMAMALDRPGITVLTWEDMNQFILQTMGAANGFYYIIYVIVILVVAILIANTLLMSVFERTREMGILASLGMKDSQVMVMILLEAAVLALIGIAIGLILGLGAVFYMSRVGVNMGEDTMSLVEGMAMGSRLYPAMAPDQFAILSLLMLGIVVLVSVYPAWVAARMEPVEALHTF